MDDFKGCLLVGKSEYSQKEDGIELSAKTVNEILIANDLASAQSRKKRPKFYKSLCQKIPNGLLSLDGSNFIIWIDNVPFTFNVEGSITSLLMVLIGFGIKNS